MSSYCLCNKYFLVYLDSSLSCSLSLPILIKLNSSPTSTITDFNPHRLQPSRLQPSPSTPPTFISPLHLLSYDCFGLSWVFYWNSKNKFLFSPTQSCSCNLGKGDGVGDLTHPGLTRAEDWNMQLRFIWPGLHEREPWVMEMIRKCQDMVTIL